MGDILTARQETPSPSALMSGAIRILSKIRFSNGQIELRPSGVTKTGMILIRPGDLVLSGINALKGAIAVYDETASGPIAATIHYGAYIPNRARVDIRFLWWLLRSPVLRANLEKFLPGGIKTELKARRFLSIPIPLPPLTEQKRILARIQDILSRIEEARGLRLAAAQQTRLLLVAHVSAISRQFPERVPFATFFAEPISGGKSVRSSETPPGVLTLKLSAISFGEFDSSQTKYAPLHIAADSDLWLKPDDILISRSNTPDLVGRAAIYAGTPENCIYPDLMYRVRLDKERALPRCFHWMLQSAQTRDHIRSRARGTSPTMKKISQSVVEDIPMPVVSMEEQHRIVRHLDDLLAKTSELKLVQAKTLEKLDALVPSILASAFAGEL